MDIDRFIDKSRARQIKAEIGTVLMRDWDPIGVKDEPAAADEYDLYIGEIFEFLKRGENEQVISDHLRTIEIERMGYADFQVPQYLDVACTLKRISIE